MATDRCSVIKGKFITALIIQKKGWAGKY